VAILSLHLHAMAKKRERSVNVSGKPKHSNDANRSNDSKIQSRSAATVRRLKTYNTKPVRNRKGRVLWEQYQQSELPSTRIKPDRQWFGNPHVVNQKELEFFREEMAKHSSSNYNVIIKGKNLPMSLLNDYQKQSRVHLLDREPFLHAFGPKTKRKRPSLLASDYESLAKKADGSQDAFEESNEADDGFRDLVRHTMFEKQTHMG
jgi:nuclear GTP-binding protein